MEPTPEDLEKLGALTSDLGSASDEIRSERRKRFLNVLGESMGSMLGSNLPEEKREAIVEGYKEMMAGIFPDTSIPPRGAIMVPPAALQQPPPSVFSEEDNGILEPIDFNFLLNSCVHQSIDLQTMTANMLMVSGHSVILSRGQTKALLKYIKAISAFTVYIGSFRYSAADLTLMEHPKVVALLAEMEPEQ